MSHWPLRLETNATDRPSGDNVGCASTPAKFVTGLNRIREPTLGLGRAVSSSPTIAPAATSTARTATAHANRADDRILRCCFVTPDHAGELGCSSSRRASPA